MTSGRIRRAGALLALGLALAGCADDGDSGGASDAPSTAGSEVIRTIRPGTLTVCSDIPYAPFDLRRGGAFTGFDGDLVHEIAAGLDLELRVEDIGFDALQTGVALNADRCDMVASAMEITEAREAELDFTEAYYVMELSLLVRAGSDIAELDELAGRTIGVLQGTDGKSYAEANAPSDATVIGFASDTAMLGAMVARQVDAVLQDHPVNLARADGGAFRVVETYPTEEEYGFAVKQGNTSLRDAINEQLTELRDDGTYQAIHDEYFGIT